MDFSVREAVQGLTSNIYSHSHKKETKSGNFCREEPLSFEFTKHAEKH